MTHSRDIVDGGDADADDLDTPNTTTAVVAAPRFTNDNALNGIKTVTMMIMMMLEMMKMKC